VETWGLKVTLRDGLGGLVELGKCEGRGEVASEAAEVIMRSVRGKMGCFRPGVTIWVLTVTYHVGRCTVRRPLRFDSFPRSLT